MSDAPSPFAGLRRGRLPRLLLSTLLAVWTAACASSSSSTTVSTGAVFDASATRPGCPALAPVYPQETWERLRTPECAGWSSAGLEAVREKLSTMSSTAFLAVVGGRVLMEYGDLERISYLASVRKSILSMLYGIYVERGVIDLDETLAQLGIDDVGGLTDQEKQARVRDLLSARSGIYHAASNGGDDLASAPPRGSQKPGEYYLYNNWDFNALGTIFEQKTGKDIYDAFGEHLAEPLDMQDWDRSIQRKSGNRNQSIHLAYHFNLTTRDMARIGYLMLRGGAWDGEQIVPRDWVRESTSAITRRTEMNPERRRSGPFGYGYLWWVFDNPDLPDVYDGAFTGLGAVGQHIFVMPALDLVIAHKTEPGAGRSVSHEQFLDVVALLLEAHCAAVCAAR